MIIDVLYRNRWGSCAQAWPRNRPYAHEHEHGLGIFAPLKMPMRMNPKILCFLDFLAIYQLKFFYKQYNSTKLDKGFRLVYKLSCLNTKKNLTFFLVKLKIFRHSRSGSKGNFENFSNKVKIKKVRVIGAER